MTGGWADSRGDDMRIYEERKQFFDSLNVTDNLVAAAATMEAWGLDQLFQDEHPGCLVADSLLSVRLEGCFDWLWLNFEYPGPPIDIYQFRTSLVGLTSFGAEANRLFPYVAAAAGSATDVTNPDVLALIDEAPDYFYGQRPTSLGRAALDMGWLSTQSLGAGITLDLAFREYCHFV